MSSPGELLDSLGFDWVQTTSETYGYSGSFTPRCAFGHWTASAAGSDVSSDVLWARSYHCCVARSGLIRLGGWQVRQGHGGEGRSTPMRLAVTGMMTLDALEQWQASAQGDDTSSAPNQYGYGVCLDNNGVGELVPDAQWQAWCAAMACFVVLAGGTSVGYVIDHSGSTNRKIDLSGSPVIDVVAWWNTIGSYIDQLLDRPAPGRFPKMYTILREDKTGHMWFSDKMTVRWMKTEFDWHNAQDRMDDYGLSTEALTVTRDSLELQEWGVIIGEMPPW